jgi:hypothetical protein
MIVGLRQTVRIEARKRHDEERKHAYARVQTKKCSIDEEDQKELVIGQMYAFT